MDKPDLEMENQTSSQLGGSSFNGNVICFRRSLPSILGILFFGALIVWAVFFLLFPKPHPGITVENFCLLRKGMPEEKIEAILGNAGKEIPMGEGSGPVCYKKIWVNGDWYVEIGFCCDCTWDEGIEKRENKFAFYGRCYKLQGKTDTWHLQEQSDSILLRVLRLVGL